MKSTYFLCQKAQRKSKFVSQKQNRKKLMSNNKNNKTYFECFDVRPQHCNFCFFLQQKQQQELCCPGLSNNKLFYKSQTAFFLKGFICY